MKKAIILSAIISLINVPALKAQKLPNVQETSLRAPVNVKVDGKATEWNNGFQAYNRATEIYYTVSNDNNNLYLTIQTTDIDISNKIICSGVTFMINGSGKMKDQGGIAITFPALKRDQFGGVGQPDGRLSSSLPPIDYRKETVAMNEQLNSIARDIKVTGIKGIQDSISLYNSEGIKAAGLFNEDKVFTCEMSLPLKYLKLQENEKSLIYSIKIDGPLIRNLTRRNLTSLRVVNGVDIMEGPDAPRIQSLIATTDFWGEYTLAK